MSQSYHSGMSQASLMAQSIASTSARSGCSESSVELLLLEAIRYYQQGQDTVSTKHALEALGFQVGAQLAERFSVGLPRLNDPLDKVKFVCKDFWSKLFKKTVDGLKTNHKGTYVLEDSQFKWLMRLRPAPSETQNRAAQPLSSTVTAAQQARSEMIQLYIVLSCGFLRGALFHLNMPSTVTGQCDGPPHCRFTIVSGTAQQAL